VAALETSGMEAVLSLLVLGVETPIECTNKENCCKIHPIVVER